MTTTAISKLRKGWNPLHNSLGPSLSPVSRFIPHQRPPLDPGANFDICLDPQTPRKKMGMPQNDGLVLFFVFCFSSFFSSSVWWSFQATHGYPLQTKNEAPGGPALLGSSHRGARGSPPLCARHLRDKEFPSSEGTSGHQCGCAGVATHD